MFNRSLVPVRKNQFDVIFDQFFNDFFNSAIDTDFDFFKSPHEQVSKSTFPKVDINSTKNNYKIEATIPGMSKEDIQISLDTRNNVKILTIKGKRNIILNEKDDCCIRKEIHNSSFSRSFTMPTDIDYNKDIKASANNGILTIEIPKLSDKNAETENSTEIKIT